jgi:hypothetical protein
MPLKRLFYCVSAVCITIIPLALALSCSSGVPSSAPSTGTASAVSFKKDLQPVFTANCVVCHQGSQAPGGLSLEPGVAYRNLVKAPSTESSLSRVDPGAPDKSYLLNKLQGTQAQVGGSGAQMPYGASPLSSAQIGLLQQWVSAGAPDN